jgi:hypothetical protein
MAPGARRGADDAGAHISGNSTQLQRNRPSWQLAALVRVRRIGHLRRRVVLDDRHP